MIDVAKNVHVLAISLDDFAVGSKILLDTDLK